VGQRTELKAIRSFDDLYEMLDLDAEGEEDVNDGRGHGRGRRCWDVSMGSMYFHFPYYHLFGSSESRQFHVGDILL
jgi:hypothetical protein